MTVIVGGMTKIGPPLRAARAAQGETGFTVRADDAEPAAAPVPPPALAMLDGVLALQEAEADAARDRRARRQGSALLDALAEVQLALLHGVSDRESLAGLQAVAEHVPDAADPRLRAIVAAILLRARVELARRTPPRR